MAVTQVTVTPGQDLYRLAAQFYQDATAWTLIARANGLTDPLIQTAAVLVVPDYSSLRANNGILASS